ncbi:response regulator [Desulfobacterales bacterium HSG16]|nr:response regulator [Desulfobacterales bacterium HSG16]
MIKKIGKALVVGGGISGIRAALDLAEFGYGVTLIDKASHLGGILAQLDYQFPTNNCGMCKMLPLIDRDSSSQYCLRRGLFHENIDILLSTQLASVEGEPGKFQVTLDQKSNPVDPSLCVGCGKCIQVCPVELPNCFNEGLSTRKAIYLPLPHAIPNSYRIDGNVCTLCGACVEVCPTDAVKLVDEGRKKFSILIVDDELIVRDSLKEWLEIEGGFAVEMAQSGQEALERLKEKKFRLMLLDIKMPGMDGVETLQKAKEILPDLHVVMMTAYATVETAVEAMKIGAMDYLIKPFDPDVLIPKIVKIYEELNVSAGLTLEVGAIVLSPGNSYFNPADGKDTLGYGKNPDVITGLEFERILSAAGPYEGRLVRPSDGRPIKKMAWIQCVGSRDFQTNADFCSNICCMYAIKEAMKAKERAQNAGYELDAAIFYMDMRTFGKSFQRYKDLAERCGVRFTRGRIHSVLPDKESGNLVVRHASYSGKISKDAFDMIVLAAGQRPALCTSDIAEMTGIELNSSGFPSTRPFSMSGTNQNGIVVAGTFAGLKDISESVTQAGAAALLASRVIHASGGGLALESGPAPIYADVSRENPQVMVVICSCNMASGLSEPEKLAENIKADPCVKHVLFTDRICTTSGWENLVEMVKKHHPNRLLIGACLPYLYARNLKALGEEVGINPRLMDVVDIHTPGFSDVDSQDPEYFRSMTETTLKMSIAKLKYADCASSVHAENSVFQQALIVGGGIAGMSAALAIADHGFKVDIVEHEKELGGNLRWLETTIEEHDIPSFLADTIAKVEKHPMIKVHTQSTVIASAGQVGQFFTAIEENEAPAVINLEHGVVILATGGAEAVTTSYGYGKNKKIITQKELAQKVNADELDIRSIKTLVMIQCVDSREEPRNYCSRVCCASSIKSALQFKKENPEIAIYVFYRDMMTYGFMESYFTEARKAGVIFIPYTINKKPVVTNENDSIFITAFEPIISQEIKIEPDMLVLGTGIIPTLPPSLAQTFGIALDQDGFFQEAESKWRPVDSLKEGVFACGLAHSPRNIPEAIATAEAAAQRALRILGHEYIPAGRISSTVRSSLCSLCERCIDTCPYGARTLNEDGKKVLVNSAMCQGCGLCAAVCPNSASVIEGYPMEQMLEMIDAAIL